MRDAHKVGSLHTKFEENRSSQFQLIYPATQLPCRHDRPDYFTQIICHNFIRFQPKLLLRFALMTNNEPFCVPSFRSMGVCIHVLWLCVQNNEEKIKQKFCHLQLYFRIIIWLYTEGLIATYAAAFSL